MKLIKLSESFALTFLLLAACASGAADEGTTFGTFSTVDSGNQDASDEIGTDGSTDGMDSSTDSSTTEPTSTRARARATRPARPTRPPASTSVVTG